MPEYFGKYEDFEMVKTNKSIDEPIIFRWGLTLKELGLGLIVFFVGVYIFMILLGSPWSVIGGVFCLIAYPVTKFMKTIRTDYPRNFFMQYLWLIGKNDIGGILGKTKERVFGP